MQRKSRPRRLWGRQKRLTEIDRHRAAKRAFNELGRQKLPSKKSLDMEYSQLLMKKKDAYAAYRDAREQARELLTHRENLRPYLALLAGCVPFFFGSLLYRQKDLTLSLPFFENRLFARAL